MKRYFCFMAGCCLIATFVCLKENNAVYAALGGGVFMLTLILGIRK